MPRCLGSFPSNHLVHLRASIVASGFDYLHGVVPLAIAHVQVGHLNAAILRRRTATDGLPEGDLVTARATACESATPPPLLHADIVVPGFWALGAVCCVKRSPLLPSKGKPRRWLLQRITNLCMCSSRKNLTNNGYGSKTRATRNIPRIPKTLRTCRGRSEPRGCCRGPCTCSSKARTARPREVSLG